VQDAKNNYEILIRTEKSDSGYITVSRVGYFILLEIDRAGDEGITTDRLVEIMKTKPEYRGVGYTEEVIDPFIDQMIEYSVILDKPYEPTF
jgi:hypothetical protein